MMSFASSLKFPIYLTLMTTLLSATSLIDGAIFTVTNNCSYTIWAAAIPGGGQLLNPSQTWFINVSEGTTGRIWARTGCIFNESGYESYVSCQTGDCKGLLRCQTYGTPPNTFAKYALNQFMTNLDFFAISLVNGFNVPMDFSPTSNGCTRGIRCSADINGQCPAQLRAPGGCNNLCTVFKTDQYCCTSGGRCDPTDFSRFFKTGCPDAYSYPKDDQTSTFTCPGGTNYRVVFCPEAVLTKITTSNITVSTVNVNCSQSILPAQTKIAAVAPAFKGCNKQFYFSLTK